MDYYSQVQQAAEYLRSNIPFTPQVALVLGSGLGPLAQTLDHAKVIPYAQVPHLPLSTVEGHAGQFVAGYLEQLPLLAMQGRFHYYEGYSMQQVTMPVRIFHELGIQTLILTNAAGGCNPDFLPGDIMLITDHINLMPNPLLGPNEAHWGPRFPSMHQAYAPALQALAQRAAQQAHIPLRQGVYLGTTGPSFETPHEYQAFHRLGADAVGMSTVPEVITAAHCGLATMALSLITNVGGLAHPQAVSHEEVQQQGERAARNMQALLKAILHEIGTHSAGGPSNA